MYCAIIMCIGNHIVSCGARAFPFPFIKNTDFTPSKCNPNPPHLEVLTNQLLTFTRKIKPLKYILKAMPEAIEYMLLIYSRDLNFRWKIHVHVRTMHNFSKENDAPHFQSIPFFLILRNCFDSFLTCQKKKKRIERRGKNNNKMCENGFVRCEYNQN